MERLKAFVKNRENQIFLLILLFAIGIRLYFFFRTYNQALWWDEADYMSIAKNYGLGTPEVAAPWRARGMSLIFGIFYFLGANEIFQRLLMVAVSSAAVYLTYFLGKEFFNKKVALIASVFMAVNWVHLFWANRFSGETFGLIFFGFAALFFWKGYVKNESKYYMIASGALIAYGIFLYESVGSIFVFLFLYLFLTERFKFLKNKQFWWGMLGLAIVLSLVFWHYYSLYGQIYPRVSHIIDGSLLQGQELDQKLQEQGLLSVFFTAFVFFANMLDYLGWVLLIAFLLGLFCYIDLVFGMDLLIKGTELRFKKDFYILWWALCVLLFFGAYLAVVKTYYEPRYIFPAYPALFLIAAQGVVLVSDYCEKYKKYLGTIVMIAVVLLAIYSHITLANTIIEAKKTSYSQERPAGEWLKEHTQKGDILLACSQVVPLVYYSEKEVITFRYNTTEVDEQIKNWSVPYLILDGYIQDCNANYVTEREANLTPMQVYYEGEQPAIIIYQTKGYF